MIKQSSFPFLVIKNHPDKQENEDNDVRRIKSHPFGHGKERGKVETGMVTKRTAGVKGPEFY